MNEDANVDGGFLAVAKAKQQVVGCSPGLKGWRADSDSGSSISNQQPTSHPSACYSPLHSLETNHNEQHIHHNVLSI